LPPTVLVYDGACGSGGMLTESQNFIQAPEIAPNTQVFLYGKEVNGETYAICKSDMMIKENSPENIRFGSTLATNDFSKLKFDFMLENPPYGKSWKSDQKYIMDGNNIMDSRFEVELPNFKGEWETVKAVPHSTDGQLLFLMDMVNRMKPLTQSPLGSRIGCVHNGSALFTGDAGSGQSNIRRYILENDWLEAIIQLSQNIFYNGVWVEYESDSDLRDTEDVPLNYALSIDPTTNHGRGKQQIHEFFLQEVRPHVADAWLDLNKTQIGYEISFNKYFYQHEPLRSLEEVTQEIWELEQETEGLFKNLLSFGLEDTSS